MIELFKIEYENNTPNEKHYGLMDVANESILLSSDYVMHKDISSIFDIVCDKNSEYPWHCAGDFYSSLFNDKISYANKITIKKFKDMNEVRTLKETNPEYFI